MGTKGRCGCAAPNLKPAFKPPTALYLFQYRQEDFCSVPTAYSAMTGFM